MRRTVKATIGVTTVAGALAVGGGTALATFSSPNLTSTWSGTADADMLQAATSQSPDEQSGTGEFTVTDQDGTTRTVSTTGATTEEGQESATADQNEAEDTETADTNSAPAGFQSNQGRHEGWSHAPHHGAASGGAATENTSDTDNG